MAINLRSRVRATLKRRRRNQGWLAEQVGISEPHLSRILTGKRTPSLPIAVKLEAATGVPARDFARAA
jgi:transcriptional regulator with XRE-family HTH domain